FAQRHYLDGEDIVAKLPRAGDSCENVRAEIINEGKVIYQFWDGQIVDAGTSIEVFGMSQKLRNFALLLANEKTGSAFTLKAESDVVFEVLCDAVNLDLKVLNDEYQQDYHDLLAARVGDGASARVEKIREDYPRLFNTPAWSKPGKHRQAIQEIIEKAMIDRIKSRYGNVKKGLRGTLSGKFVDTSSLMGWGYGVFDSSHGVRLVDLSPDQVEWARENLGRRLRLSNETGNAKDLKMTLGENAGLQVETDLRSL
nr:hypothetical protein [Candidatus Eremiobacteraeota bacterium]